jgi:hypothetical protein
VALSVSMAGWLPVSSATRASVTCACAAALACLAACSAPPPARPSNAPRTARAAIVPFPAVTASPGWQHVPSPALHPSGSYDAITATGPAEAWAAGSEGTGQPPAYGHPVVVHWNGARWARMALPPSTSELTGFTALVASSSSDVWAAGASVGGPVSYFVYHFDGVAWAGVPLPAIADFNAPVAGMAITPDGHVWVVGSGLRGSFILRWDGSGWTQPPLPAPGLRPAGIVARTNTDVWVTGDIREMYHWDGTRWRHVPTPASQPGSVPYLAAAGPDDVWAVGGAGGGDLAGGSCPGCIGMHFTQPVSAVLHWDGRSWRRLAVGNAGPLHGITPDGTGGVWISANAYTYSRSSLYLHWRTGTWTGIYSWPPPPPGTEDNTVVAQIPGSQRVWSAGAGPDGGNIELYTP